MAPLRLPSHRRRQALDRHAWADAFELFSKADADGDLSGSDLEGLSDAAWFTAHAAAATDAKERAFRAYVAEGDPVRAAYLALKLTQEYAFRGKSSIASAWMRRGERLLDGNQESFANGYLALVVPIFHEFHFFCIHRLIHWPPLYRWLHSVHHHSVNPSPWSSLSMHPVEGLLYHAVALWHLVIPSNPIIALFQLHIAGFAAVTTSFHSFSCA